MPTARSERDIDHEHLRVPSSYSRVIARELGLSERELPGLLAGTDLPTRILLPEDHSRISVEQQLRILDNVRRIAGEARAGLLVGRALQPASHGPVGFLALSSPSARAALEALRDFLPTRIPFVGVALTEDDRELCSAQRLFLHVDEPRRRQMHESYAMVVQLLLEAVVGDAIDGLRFEFAHGEPQDFAPYREFLHGPCAFNCPQTAVYLPLTQAQRGNARGDTSAYALARETCERLLSEVSAQAVQTSSTSARVRRLLLTLPAGSLNEEQAARYLFVSRRTLCRRLASEGNSFRGIRERVWADLALQHLADPRLSVDSIATMLGYADSAAFRKACRRWFGMPPSALRQAKRAP